MTENFVYKIRRRSDCLFSSGTCYPKFSKNGKIWSGIGALKLHFQLFGDNNFRRTYGNCEVVAYKLEAIDTIGINNLFSSELRKANLEFFVKNLSKEE